jgi:hypothetical protein
MNSGNLPLVIAAISWTQFSTEKGRFFLLNIGTYRHISTITGSHTSSRLGFASAVEMKFSDRIVPNRQAIPIFFIDMIITEIVASTFGRKDSMRLL